MGRHYAPGDPAAESPRRRNLARAVLGLGLVAVLVAGLVAILGGKFERCDSGPNVTVMADPALAAAVRSQAGLVGECGGFTVIEKPDQQAAGALSGAGQTPDLWLAPSRLRADEVSAQLGRELPTTAVAASPLVLAGAKIDQPASWLDAVTQATIRAVPADSPFSGAPVVAGVSEAGAPGGNAQALTGALARYAQAAKRVSGEPVAAAAADGGVVVVPEYAFLAARASHEASAVVPKTGAPRAELLLAVTATGERLTAAQDAGRRLATAFSSADGRAALARDGLRGIDLQPAPSNGVGAVTALPAPDSAKLATAEEAFRTLAVPLRALVVVDTSGSMEEKAGSGKATRIGMLASGFTKVVSQIPDANAVGLWTFSLASGGGRDWTEVVPTAPLSEQRDGKSQRQLLLAAASALPGKVGGGTGLYDTTLAAYRQAVKDFDPAYSNSLILLSDGGNEKSGGLTLDQLVAELKKLADPTRPVNIHTVGISDDADLPALRRIADATGGTAQSADSEEQMLTDFVTAIAKRAK